jgi:adenylate kinase family enzyme
MSFIINGKGTAGKDYFVNTISSKYKVMNVSSVDLLYKIMNVIEWDGIKTDIWRQVMSDIKISLEKLDDVPYKYMIKKYREFLNNDDEFIFFHIRENYNIGKMKSTIINENIIDCKTLLVDNKYIDRIYNNRADDNVYDYKYDYVFENKPGITTYDNIIDYFNNIIN